MPHAANRDLATSDTGLALIERWEGFEPDWYLDAVGVRTIGYGWTHALPDGFTAPLTKSEARRLLRLGVADYEQAVRDAVAVPLNRNEFDALVSFTYNLGPGALRRSTLLRRLNGGDRDGAAAEFGKWVKAGGQTLRGLVRRREAERALFVLPYPAEPCDLVDPEPTPPKQPVPLAVEDGIVDDPSGALGWFASLRAAIRAKLGRLTEEVSA